MKPSYHYSQLRSVRYEARSSFRGRLCLSVVFSALCGGAGQSEYREIPASAASLSGNPSGEITEQYDKFNDVTNVLLKPMPMPCPLGEEAWLTAQFSYPGRTLQRPDKAMIAFVFASKEAKFRQSDELIVLVDGERLRVGEMYRDVDFSSRHENPIRETMAQIIPHAIFTRIAHAKKIEAKLGIFEFSLSDENLLALRELAARMASK